MGRFAHLFFSSSQKLIQCICCTQNSGNNEITIKSCKLFFSIALSMPIDKKLIGRGSIFSNVLILSSQPPSPASLTLTHNVFVPVFCIHLVPFPLSLPGSLLLSQLDIPDVPLIWHTNVILLLYNHQFSRFHALSPNLRHVLRILFHSSTPDYISFHFIYSVFV